MQMTKEQLEALIADQIKGQITAMGAQWTESMKEQVGDVIKSFLSEKPDLRKFLIDDEENQQRTPGQGGIYVRNQGLWHSWLRTRGKMRWMGVILP